MKKLPLPSLQSSFAVLDVKHGRKALARHFEPNGVPVRYPNPEPASIPVVIFGEITGVNENDDGISQGFSVKVHKVEAGKARKL